MSKKKRELIDDILDPNYNFNDYKNSEIPTKCLSCKFQENVPDYIYDEFSKKKFHLEKKKWIPTLYCAKCQKEKAIPLSMF